MTETKYAHKLSTTINYDIYWKVKSFPFLNFEAKVINTKFFAEKK